MHVKEPGGEALGLGGGDVFVKDDRIYYWFLAWRCYVKSFLSGSSMDVSSEWQPELSFLFL